MHFVHNYLSWYISHQNYIMCWNCNEKNPNITRQQLLKIQINGRKQNMQWKINSNFFFFHHTNFNDFDNQRNICPPPFQWILMKHELQYCFFAHIDCTLANKSIRKLFGWLNYIDFWVRLSIGSSQYMFHIVPTNRPQLTDKINTKNE